MQVLQGVREAFLGTAGYADWLMLVLPVLAGAGALWLLVAVASRVARRDWIQATLMLVSYPMFAVWLRATEAAGALALSLTVQPARWDGLMAKLLLGLAAASFLSVRLRRRDMKLLLPLAVGVCSAGYLVHQIWGSPGMFRHFVLPAVLLGVVVSPAAIPARPNRG
jgi:hypothetical protein